MSKKVNKLWTPKTYRFRVCWMSGRCIRATL